MPNLNDLAFGLISVLLTLCAVFLFIKTDNQAIEIAHGQTFSPKVRVCGDTSPWITVLSETQFKVHGQFFDVERLLVHIQNDFYEYPFNAVIIHAPEEIQSGVVTRLTSDLKHAIPGTQVVWTYIQ